MKPTITVLLLLFSTTLSAQDSMADYIEAARPVEEHERLAELTGPWNVTTRFWFEKPDEPLVSSGTGTGRLILGGRFLVLETDTRGAFEAQSMTLLGFDRRTSEFTLVGADTLGTYTISAAGKGDAQRVTMRGSYAQPPSGKMQKYTFVWTRPSEREHLLTLFFDLAGKEVRVAETRMVRP